MCPRLRRTPLPTVVHPQGEAEVLAEMCPSPTVPPIRLLWAIGQLPDLGLSLQPGCPPIVITGSSPVTTRRYAPTRLVYCWASPKGERRHVARLPVIVAARGHRYC